MVGRVQVMLHQRNAGLFLVAEGNVDRPRVRPSGHGRREGRARSVHPHAWLAAPRLAESAKVAEEQDS